MLFEFPINPLLGTQKGRHIAQHMFVDTDEWLCLQEAAQNECREPAETDLSGFLRFSVHVCFKGAEIYNVPGASSSVVVSKGTEGAIESLI